jgi:hypothetical protein
VTSIADCRSQIADCPSPPTPLPASRGEGSRFAHAARPAP